MKHITGKGIMFSLDFAIAFLLILVIMLVSAAAIHLTENEELNELKEKSLQEDRVMLMDALVKKPADGNLPGLAFFDSEKRRVKENQLVAIELKGQETLEDFGLKELWLECDTRKKLFESEQEENECVVLVRMVFEGAEKCLLKGKFCGE